MESESNQENQSANCCGGTNQESGTSCECGAPKRRSWIKILLFAIVMLAAVGVGTYSLIASSTTPVAKQGCGDCKEKCCPK